MAASDNFPSIGIDPPSKNFEFKNPKTILASVKVISLPPLLYAIGPGKEPALLGPTFNRWPSSNQTILPPPAPISDISINGSFTAYPAPLVYLLDKFIPEPTSYSDVLLGSKFSIIAVFAVVPPISRVITSLIFFFLANSTAAITPAAGPDSSK